ncbi:protein kinase [Nonomuraea sp. NPDC050556]|uniref:protein kinase domain-containing protein n=1 Tax=Nonomuraea sp. NPDC050556 TaxID=3364369 RepID=UPI0037A87864
MKRPPDPTEPDDPPPAPTVAETATDSGRTERPSATDALPPELAARFSDPELLSSESGEALVYRVRDLDGQTVVLKVYNARSPNRQEVYAGLDRVTSAHVVKPYDRDNGTGPQWEVSEYLPHGSLRDLMEEHRHGLPTDLIRLIAQQCAEALGQLHANHVKHRDIKPDNILVRTRSPLCVALTDFGIARRDTEHTRQTSSRSGTVVYMSPEALAGLVSPADDWWSLGISIAELALGEHPLAVSPMAYKTQVVSGTIDVRAIADPDVRMLCQGLLLNNPVHRWKEKAVRDWLAGDPPILVREQVTPEVRPLEFAGISYFSPADLAARLALNWAAGIVWTQDHEEELLDWLSQFPGSDPDVIRRHHGPPDVHQLYVIRAINPDSPPSYRAVALAPEHLPGLAGIAVRDPDGLASRILMDLWRHRLLTVLDRFAGGAGLADYDARWRANEVRWREVVSRLRHAGAPVDGLDRRDVLAELLLLTCEPRSRIAELRSVAASTRSTLLAMRVRLPWYDWDAEAGPVETLAAALLAHSAREAADERHRVWADYLDDQRRRALRRWLNRTQRSTALGWAALAVAVPAVAFVVALTISDLIGMAPPESVTQSWLWAALCVLIVVATEVPFAARLGRQYHPWYSLASTMIAAGSLVVHPMRGRKWLALLSICVAALALAGALALAPVLVPAAAIAGHMTWLVLRARRFQAREGSRGETLGAST